MVDKKIDIKNFKDDDLVTRSELSLILNVSKPYISKLTKKGILIFDKERNKKIRLSDAKKSIEENSDPARQKFEEEKEKNKSVFDVSKKKKVKPKDPVNDGDDEEGNEESEEDKFLTKKLEEFINETSKMSFSDAKTRNEQMKLLISKLKSDREMSKLVDIEDVKRNAFEIGSILNKLLSTIPAKNCDTLASITDPKKVYNRLSEIIYDITNEIMEKLEGFNNEE